MKKSLIILFMLVFSMTQSLFAQKQGYSEDFNSEQEIRNYLAKNIAILDPLEGEYDMECTGEYITPFVHQYYPRSRNKLFIVYNNNKFSAYVSADGEFGETYLSVKPIGKTNAYWMFFDTTPTRIYLQDNNHFTATFELNNSSARNFTGNNRLATSVKINLTNDCIKIYPTATMYADAARSSKEKIQPSEWTGTGFALNNNYIVTNNHVVEGANNIYIQGINGDFNHKYNAEVVVTDKHNDLAIIKLKGIKISSIGIPYSVQYSVSEVGEEVFVLGYPLTSTMGDEIKLTTGVISSKTGYQGDVAMYQISAPIQPGNSGGPLFDSKGNVIGIISAKHKGAENVGYAIKTSYLKNLIESTFPVNVLPHINKMTGKNLSGKVKMLKNYVYYITCTSGNVLQNETPARSYDTKQTPSTSTNPIAAYFSADRYSKNIEAAKRGNPKAQYDIAQCYDDGIGVAKNLLLAAYWYQKAAEQNYASGQNGLGGCYFKGKGVPVDYEKAAYWFKKAADNGSAAGEINYKEAKKREEQQHLLEYKRIQSPHVQRINNKYTSLQYILLTPKETVLYLCYRNPNEESLWYPYDKACIITNGQEYNIQSSEGLPDTNEESTWMPAGANKEFALHFPALPKGVEVFNLKLGGITGCDDIIGISIKH